MWGDITRIARLGSVVVWPVEIASHRLVVDVEDKGRGDGDGGPSSGDRTVLPEVQVEIEDAELVGLCEI